MIIREATDLDINAIHGIEVECFVEPYTLNQLLYELKENPVSEILVAVDGNKVIAFIDYMITFNSATISQIAVKKEYRKQGIATQLLKAMENSFSKNYEDAVETVTLEVRESNEPARKLYEKDGYEFVVMKNKYYNNGENAVYMVKRLLCQ